MASPRPIPEDGTNREQPLRPIQIQALTISIDYRHIRLEDRNCPECQSGIVTICKANGQGEEYWFNCAAPNEECGWGQDTMTHKSDERRVSSEEARARFDQQFE